ncbi:hypothetical protein HMPREF9551_03098 [Escherichia coli MS 196-1]|nr:hypothetical protein HMPREF9551_03098 [Escherichia coli MS 196-1]
MESEQDESRRIKVSSSMEDSVVTTRSLQWGQRILTAATDKFQKREYT